MSAVKMTDSNVEESKDSVEPQSKKPEFRTDVKVGYCIKIENSYYQLKTINTEDSNDFTFVPITKEEYEDICFVCIKVKDGCILDLTLDNTNVTSWIIESGKIKSLPRVIEVVVGDRLVFKDAVYVVPRNVLYYSKFPLEDDYPHRVSSHVRKFDIEIGDIINIVDLKSKWKVKNFHGVFFDKV